MRKIILSLAVSLDGYIEGPNGEYDWCFTDQDYGMSEFFKRVDTVFIGRKSYEMSLGMEGADTSWMPKMKEYVFSNTLRNVKEGVSVVSGNIKQEVEKIKSEPGKDIWLFGGASLITTLMNEKLVDEISMAVHPILLGAGKPLFIDITGRIPLKLVNTQTYNTGLVTMAYELLK
jgi:dihydrofolate reductase